jgi:hypothetical protein
MVQFAWPGWLVLGSLGNPELQLSRAGFHIPIHVNSVALQIQGLGYSFATGPDQSALNFANPDSPLVHSKVG